MSHDDKVWFVHRTGRDLVGPVSAELIHRGVKEGKIPEDSIVAREGDDEWIAVGDLVAKLDLFEDDPTQHLANPFLTDVHPVVRRERLELPPQRQLPLAQRSTLAKASPRPTFMVFIPGSREPPRGPWGIDEIRSRRESGALLAAAKVCRVGDHQWDAVDDVITLGDGAREHPTVLPIEEVVPLQPAPVVGSPKIATPEGSKRQFTVRRPWIPVAVGVGVVVALVPIWLSTRSGPENSPSPAMTAPSSETTAPTTSPPTSDASQENEAAPQAEKKRLLEDAAQKALEQKSICAAKGRWPLAPSLARVSALGPWVVTGHEMATQRASKVTISELGAERVATEIERLENSVREIDVHQHLPGEEKIKKQLLANFKGLIALNKKWRAAMLSYSGSLGAFDGLPEATTKTITKISSNDVDRAEACLGPTEVPSSSAEDAAPKPAPAPKKKACHACYYNGSCVRLGGSPCCEPIVEHVSEDPKEAAKCRQLGR